MFELQYKGPLKSPQWNKLQLILHYRTLLLQWVTWRFLPQLPNSSWVPGFPGPTCIYGYTAGHTFPPTQILSHFKVFAQLVEEQTGKENCDWDHCLTELNNKKQSPLESTWSVLHVPLWTVKLKLQSTICIMTFKQSKPIFSSQLK